MKKKLIILALSILLLIILLLIYKNCKNSHITSIYNSLVYIESIDDNEEKSGSGFVYYSSNDKNYILTASHIIGDNAYIKVYNKKKKNINAKVIFNDEYNDVAILEVDDILDLKNAKIGNSDDLKIKDLIYVIGNPLGLENFGTITKGRIVNLNSINGIFDFNVIEVSAQTDYGNSGSPVLDKNGKVVGMLFLKSTDKTNSSYMIPMNYILKSINKKIR